ncbi:MAG: tRNA (5-methylaminomethyl-2-thiouridine)(34)-methyltransferase MnmD [Rikenellaceae bacterium]|jgi:tRNA U34 5-methylaminomethyl-2-thiouridine-forming methyltransferase MnmC|nr:tRNA (5-methylaminomethyl-2-thiouridine)(34)-methyltransferase MnmD [Rikenellaceae bacterium]
MKIDPIRPEIVPTEDGSPTLRHPALGEMYHSLRGAVGESEHVFIRAGFDRIEKPHLRIFEMGFGTGLNALLTLRRAHEAGKTVEYLAVERYPVAPEVASALGYESPDNRFFDAFEAMHRAPWGEAVEVDPRFRLTKVCGSLPEIEFDAIFDVIYFDAFAPDTQPELWTEAIFRRLYEHTAPGGVLVTYSAKGTVKQALRSAGYRVERLPGALGKRHMIRAVKD